MDDNFLKMLFTWDQKRYMITRKLNRFDIFDYYFILKITYKSV